jgi:hypothetical protein
LTQLGSIGGFTKNNTKEAAQVRKHARRVAVALRITAAATAEDLRQLHQREAKALRDQAVIVARHLKSEATSKQVSKNLKYLEKLLRQVGKTSSRS